MKKIKDVIYGLGGYDESKPDNNVIETTYYTDAELLEIAEEEVKATQKQALLNKLGLTAEEAQLLLGGN